MRESDFESYSKYYDQIYLKMKDYKKETEILRSVIKQFEKKSSKTLLDVGCGTGEHLKQLCQDFQCSAIDVNTDMVRIAKSKVPNARFKIANMIDFRLKEKFDVIVCLFGAIGYVQTFINLVKTLRNFHEHLNENGLVIVEPWIFKKDFKKDFIGLSTYEDEQLKLARMATSKLAKSKWLILMHYLIGENGKIKYAEEVHEMLAVDYEDYLKAFQLAEFDEVDFLKENLWDSCRGLFVANK